MCAGDAMSPPTSDGYITIPPAPAAPKLSPAPPPPPVFCWAPTAKFIYFGFSSVFTILIVLIFVISKVPVWQEDLMVETLSPSSSSSGSAAVVWDVSFSGSDTTTYKNLSMEATLFRGHVAVSDSTTLGPVVNATVTATASATFSIADATVLEARYLTPCLAVSNLTVKLEVEEPVPIIKTSKRLVIVCENVVVLWSSNRSSCYSSSLPALLDRAPCRNDGMDLSGTLIIAVPYTPLIVFGLAILTSYALERAAWKKRAHIASLESYRATLR